MIKASFAVGYRKGRESHVVLGVTSIVPNLNGVLMFTEDGENHFIESCEIPNGLCNAYIDYEQDDCIEMADKVFDHRKK